MRKKLLYTAPDAELLVVRFEESMMQTYNPNGTSQGNGKKPFGAPAYSPFDDEDDLDY